ncbi:MAG: threonine/serine dehydratase [Pseudomonadota bacterium]
MSQLTLPTYENVRLASARIAEYIYQTPVLVNAVLDDIAGANCFFKAECLQQTGSFKLRGAINRLLQIPEDHRRAGVVAFSSGNHAQGVARAARLLGMPALIVMPEDAPKIKVDGVRRDAGEIRFYDRARESREEIATAIATERNATLVPSFDDPMIVAGQGTCGLELYEQVDELDAIVCCTGGGGLITGIALTYEGLSPHTEIWTAEPEGHEDWQRSLLTGELVSNASGVRSICDAILTPQPGQLTWALGNRLLKGGLVVSDDQIRRAMQLAFRNLKVVLEPGGAAALAAILFAMPKHFKGKRIGVILTGGNVDAEVFSQILRY